MKNFEYTSERFADLQMLRYHLDGFDELSLQQKLYIYCLSEATLWGRDIVTDQKCCHNLEVRRVLEAIYLHSKDNANKYDASQLAEMVTYLKRVWFSNGIHHHYGTEKMKPGFSQEFLRESIATAGVETDLDLLIKVLFDEEFLAKGVCKDEGEDVLMASASNYYKGVSQKEAESYYSDKRQPEYGDEQPSWGLNSQLVKTEDGDLYEKVWHIGGCYSALIEKIVFWLREAQKYAENEQQKKLIDLLIHYYISGDLRTFDEYSIEWLKETEGMVDYINGFIEVYGDPLGIKASWEGLVEYKDLAACRRTRLISDNAQWFEDHSPVDKRFRKEKVRGVVANAICAAMLGGDEYPSTAIGINLPNAEWIRARYGSKSVTITNITDAYNKASKGSGFREEFVIDDDYTRTIIEKYSDFCDDLHTDLHECLGHGSGQLLPGVSQDALKNYGSTIEEARADLFGLYYIADEKLVELGLLPDMESHRSQYYTYLLNGLMTQLTRIEPGMRIEEAHMRNRALIARWVYEHAQEVGEGSAPACELITVSGKTYLRVNDYHRLRELFAELLCEIQRIKSEGDLDAARVLVETYGVQIDAVLHNEILERYKALNLAPYKGFINPSLSLVKDNNDTVTDVAVSYDETFAEQMLRYSECYSINN